LYISETKKLEKEKKQKLKIYILRGKTITAPQAVKKSTKLFGSTGQPPDLKAKGEKQTMSASREEGARNCTELCTELCNTESTVHDTMTKRT